MSLKTEKLAKTGREVAVNKPGHHMHGRIGETAGLADTIGQQKTRVHFDGQVYIFDAKDLNDA